MALTKKRKVFFIVFSAFVLITIASILVLSGTEKLSSASIQKAFNRAVKQSHIYEAVLYAEDSSGDFSYNIGYGGRDIDSPMLTASVGKLFTTACILILYGENIISLEDKLSQFLNEDELRGLHVYRGREYSFDLTIADLLFQTSGLPNTSRTLSDEDTYISFNERLEAVKLISPHFAPNTNAAYYANINFSILGEILERVTGIPLADAYNQMIFLPLGMNSTYLPVNENDYIPSFYNGDQNIHRPNNIISAGAAGGFVSTPRDLMLFIKAFWEGKLFDKSILEELAVYEKLKPYFGPVYYGGGYMQIASRGIYSLFMGKGGLIGHSGVTGSFAFYYPQNNLYFTGDFSQLQKPSAPYMMLMRLTGFK